MVTKIAFFIGQSLLVLATLLLVQPSHALLAQTQKDLQVAEDRLRFEITKQKNPGEVRPILIATPQAYWKESREDFASATRDMLARVFSETGDLIACAECFESRVFVSRDSRTVIQNGELGLSDLARLRQNPGFAQAKSILIIKETPAGVDLRWLTLEEGRILFTGLADATKSLVNADRPLRLARELERRERGDSLSYFHFDLGLYPQALVQLKWLEQWGDRNQHLSGFAISVFNPTGAIGGTYLYMLPFQRRATVGVTAYYGLSGVFQSGSTSLSDNIVLQGSFNYALSGSYGAFLAADTKGVISAGFSFQNPVFLPFLL